jgi:hypothetical protein
MSPFERRLYRAAARDRVVRSAFEQIGSRNRSPAHILNPRVLARLAPHPRRAS